MYFVDRAKIEETLNYFDELLKELEHPQYQSQIEKLSLERTVHMIIESMLDVGNMMIDGFIMRDPGSFNDIIDILVDEKVLPKNHGEEYKEVLKLRNALVKNYLHINHQHLLDVVKEHRDVLTDFSTKIKTYLNEEIGVATAFYKED